MRAVAGLFVREREYHDMNGLKGRCGACAGMGTNPETMRDVCATCYGSGIDPEAAESIARLFHESYERLAPTFGYRTREVSAVAWGDVPEDDRRLMVATAGFVVARLKGRDGGPDLDFSEEQRA